MGYNAYAHTIIGLRIDEHKLYRKVSKPGCDCDHVAVKDARFCPLCGAESKVISKEPIEAYEEEKGDGGKLAGFDLLSRGCESEPEFVIGFHVKTEESNGASFGFASIPDINKIKADMKKKLEPLGFWDEKAFGIYAVLYASY